MDNKDDKNLNDNNVSPPPVGAPKSAQSEENELNPAAKKAENNPLNNAQPSPPVGQSPEGQAKGTQGEAKQTAEAGAKPKSETKSRGDKILEGLNVNLEDEDGIIDNVIKNLKQDKSKPELKTPQTKKAEDTKPKVPEKDQPKNDDKYKQKQEEDQQQEKAKQELQKQEQLKQEHLKQVEQQQALEKQRMEQNYKNTMANLTSQDQNVQQQALANIVQGKNDLFSVKENLQTGNANVSINDAKLPDKSQQADFKADPKTDLKNAFSKVLNDNNVENQMNPADKSIQVKKEEVEQLKQQREEQEQQGKRNQLQNVPTQQADKKS